MKKKTYHVFYPGTDYSVVEADGYVQRGNVVKFYTKVHNTLDPRVAIRKTVALVSLYNIRIIRMIEENNPRGHNQTP